jgi:UDP-glucose-4-epimerase GalE
MDGSGSILVTGGAGYLGSHVCKALAAHGYTPITYDDLSTGSRDLVKWGELEHGDIGDRERLAEMFIRLRPRAVIHLAGLVVDPVSMFEPDNYYRTNVAGSLSLFRAMAEAGVDKIVYCSSAAVYGMPEDNPIDESQPLDAITPYGTSKMMTEETLPDFARAHNMDWMSLRVFNVAGADPDGEAGRQCVEDSDVVSASVRAALGKSDALQIYGTDYETADGTPVRDFVHVSDVADAHVSALEHLLAGGASGIVNIGSGKGYSVKDVVAAVARASGREVPVDEAPPRPGDPPMIVADTSLAREVLDWKPTHPDLDEVVASAWRWQTATCAQT